MWCLTWCVPGIEKGTRNWAEKKSLWCSRICSSDWLQSNIFSLFCNALADGFWICEVKISLIDLTVLKGLLSDVVGAITPSTFMAICWELETPVKSSISGSVFNWLFSEQRVITSKPKCTYRFIAWSGLRCDSQFQAGLLQRLKEKSRYPHLASS